MARRRRPRTYRWVRHWIVSANKLERSHPLQPIDVYPVHHPAKAVRQHGTVQPSADYRKEHAVRSPLNYLGGKSRLAERIVKLIPQDHLMGAVHKATLEARGHQ